MSRSLLVFLPQILIMVLAIGFTVWQKMRAGRKLGAIDSVLGPYRRGDYNAALAASEIFRTMGDMRQYHAFHGGMLSQLGRAQQAESELLQSLELARRDVDALQARDLSSRILLDSKVKLLALANESLAEMYLDQGRYLDAEKHFQTSLLNWPGHGAAHRGLAEISLRRGDPAQTSVEWAQMAVSEERGAVPDALAQRAGAKVQALSQESRNLNLGESLGTLAWALAAAGAKSEVDAVAAPALDLISGQAVTSSALVHLHVGYAYAATGDSARAEELWRAAVSIDPQGRSGRAAQLALASSSQPTVNR